MKALGRTMKWFSHCHATYARCEMKDRNAVVMFNIDFMQISFNRMKVNSSICARARVRANIDWFNKLNRCRHFWSIFILFLSLFLRFCAPFLKPFNGQYLTQYDDGNYDNQLTVDSTHISYLFFVFSINWIDARQANRNWFALRSMAHCRKIYQHIVHYIKVNESFFYFVKGPHRDRQ